MLGDKYGGKGSLRELAGDSNSVIQQPTASNKGHGAIIIFGIMTIVSVPLTATIFVLISRPSSSFIQGLRGYHHHHHHHLCQVVPFASPFYCTKFPPSSATITMTAAATNNHNTIVPPIPRRDENRAVYAGIAPPNWDSKMPRQSNDSTEKLLDPPVPIPDPYGWLRDDDRKNTEVLEYLQAENDYSMTVTKHLKGLQEKLYNDFLSR
jgi:hypothetical protein